MKQKIAYVVSTPMTARVFLAHQIHVLSKIYDVSVVANLNDATSELDNLPSGIKIISLPIERDISLFKDIHALILLIRLFSQEKFSLVHSVSPKAGLLAITAGYFARIPHRLHTFTGQVWATKVGCKRMLFKSLDKLIARLSTTVLVDSHSQRDFLIDNRILQKSESIVLNKGSISGVDLQRFRPSKDKRKSVRLELGISQDAVILLFLGRLKIDKGVVDLANAFGRINASHPETILLVIGPDEEAMQQQIISKSGAASSAVKFITFTNLPEDYMAASDIFVLPSYREGFGTVVIEAGACELPSVVSRVYGLTDAVEENETGIFFQAGNVDEIVMSIDKLIKRKDLRLQLGLNARKRVEEHFSQVKVTNELCALYNNLLDNTASDVN